MLQASSWVGHYVPNHCLDNLYSTNRPTHKATKINLSPPCNFHPPPPPHTHIGPSQVNLLNWATEIKPFPHPNNMHLEVPVEVETDKLICVLWG